MSTNKTISKWMGRLQALDGAVIERRDVHATVLRTGSPSADATFGNSWGLPLGYSMVVYGEPKAGKSVLVNNMVGQLHKDYPEAVAIKFNTEYRESSQLTTDMMGMYGIDPDRYLAYDVNGADQIFDRITKDVAAMAEEVQVGLIIIDSINHIQGRREANQDTVMTQQIGDLAQTLKVGLKRILPVQRKNRIALVMCAHVGAEFDQQEVMRGNTVKMSAGFGTQHYAEYFMLVSKNKAKAGRQTLMGEDLVDDTKKDLLDHADVTGHKIRVCMKQSSCGPAGRVGEFTLDYHRGIVNTEEEIFQLGHNRGIILREGNSKYGLKGSDVFFNGKGAMLKAIKENDELSKEILKRLKDADKRGEFKEAPEDVAPEPTVK
jgi:RecA/RadA recombinase